MAPLELTDSPVGRPVELQVKLAPVWVSVAILRSGVMAMPVVLDLLPGLATDTAPAIDQVKLAEPELPEAVGGGQGDVGGPRGGGRAGDGPGGGLMVSPVGSPVADQLKVAPEDGCRWRYWPAS